MNDPDNADAVNVEAGEPEPQNQPAQYEVNLPPVELPDDDENWWMRINLFVDDDPVETEQNGTKTDSEQEKIE
jgi:hypothetical protein